MQTKQAEVNDKLILAMYGNEHILVLDHNHDVRVALDNGITVEVEYRSFYWKLKWNFLPIICRGEIIEEGDFYVSEDSTQKIMFRDRQAYLDDFDIGTKFVVTSRTRTYTLGH